MKTHDEMIVLLNEIIRTNGNAAAWARKNRIRKQDVYDILKDRLNFNASVLRALGYEKQTVYVKKQPK